MTTTHVLDDMVKILAVDLGTYYPKGNMAFKLKQAWVLEVDGHALMQADTEEELRELYELYVDREP